MGGFLSSWNMFSHVKYWTGNDFARPVAKSIGDVVAAELLSPEVMQTDEGGTMAGIGAEPKRK